MSSPQSQANERQEREKRRRRQEGESQADYKARRRVETSRYLETREQTARREASEAAAQPTHVKETYIDASGQKRTRHTGTKFSSKFTAEQRQQQREGAFEAYRSAKDQGIAEGFELEKGRVKVTQRVEGDQLLTTAKAKYKPSKTELARQQAEITAEQNKAIQAEQARIRSLPGYVGDVTTFNKEGDAEISYSQREIYGTEIVGGPSPAKEGSFISAYGSAGTETIKASRKSLGPEQLAFIKEQEASGELRYTGEATFDKSTGQLSYSFANKADEKAYRDSLVETRKFNAEQKRQEQSFRADAESKGLIVTETTNADGSTTLSANEPTLAYNPSLAEQATGGVRYVGKAIGGIIGLGANISALYTDKVLGRKDAADKIVATGEEYSKSVEKGLGYEGLAAGARFLEPIAGKERSERAAKRYEFLAKAEKDDVIGSGFGVAVAGVQTVIPGATGGKEELERQQKAFRERPLESGLATVVDIGTFAIGGGKPKVTTKTRQQFRIAEGGKLEPIVKRYEPFKFNVEKITKEGGVKLIPSKVAAQGTVVGSAKAKPESKIKPELSERINIESNVRAGEIRPTFETDVIVRRKSGRASGGGEVRPPVTPSGGVTKKTTTTLKDIDASIKAQEIKTEGIEVTARTGQVSVLEPQKTVAKVKPKIEETKKVEITEGFVPPEERTSVSASTLGFGDSSAVIEARILDQSGKYFRTPKGIKRVGNIALKDRNLVLKQRKTEQILAKPRKELSDLEAKINREKEKLEAEKEKERLAIEADKERAPGEKVKEFDTTEKVRLENEVYKLENQKVGILERISKVEQRRKLTRADFLGAKQRAYKSEFALAKSPIEALGQKRITKQSQLPAQVYRQDVFQVQKQQTIARQTTKQQRKQAFMFKFDTLTKQLTGTKQITRQRTITGIKPISKTTTIPKTTPKLKAPPIAFFPGGGDGLQVFRPRRGGATGVSDLSVANILYGDLSIYTGKGEQAGGAKEQLSGSLTGFSLSFGKKGKKGKRRDILSL